MSVEMYANGGSVGGHHHRHLFLCHADYYFCSSICSSFPPILDAMTEKLLLAVP